MQTSVCIGLVILEETTAPFAAQLPSVECKSQKLFAVIGSDAPRTAGKPGEHDSITTRRRFGYSIPDQHQSGGTAVSVGVAGLWR